MFLLLSVFKPNLDAVLWTWHNLCWISVCMHVRQIWCNFVPRDYCLHSWRNLLIKVRNKASRFAIYEPFLKSNESMYEKKFKTTNHFLRNFLFYDFLFTTIITFVLKNERKYIQLQHVHHVVSFFSKDDMVSTKVSHFYQLWIHKWKK